MIHVVRIDVISRYHACYVNGLGKSPLAWACPRVRRIEGDNRAISGAQRTVAYGVRINILLHDSACRIDAQRVCNHVSAARRIEGGKASVGGTHEAVSHVICIEILSRDRTRRIYSGGKGALAGACPRARRSEGDKLAVGTEHVALPYAVGITVESNNHGLSHAQGLRTPSPWHIDSCEYTLGSPHEAVGHEIAIHVVSDNCPRGGHLVRPGALAGPRPRARSVEAGEFALCLQPRG